jgi:hypothetical protein
VRPPRRSLTFVALVCASFAAASVPASTAAASPPPPEPPSDAQATPADPNARRWPMPIPEGCTVPDLAAVVFLGTVVDTDFQTARYQIDQVRAGDLQPYAVGGLVDVRYGQDARFLADGTQYLIGASPARNSDVLTSKVRVTEPLFAGDDVIGVTESDVSCPQLDDPVRTLNTDGTDVDAAVFGPLLDSRGDLLRAIFLPVAAALAIVFGLATVRWILIGVGKGVGSVVSTTAQTRESRSARRKDL